MSSLDTSANQADEKVKFYMEEEPHQAQGTLLGFWIYLMSDCMIFAILFATRAVLGSNYVGTPLPRDVFDIELILVATFCLLFSSITYGFAILQMQQNKINGALLWLSITGLLGVAFVGIEVYEFMHLMQLGATPQSSASWSSFYALVGTHGLHVCFGLLWLIVLMVQIKKFGLTVANQRRMFCLSMFWHFLDLIWIGVFSLVYLTGVIL
ncbi:MAG: cytochrome o ubiquinol oxidase subunit III [Thiotrichaceae bacterium]|nr:MAG: cytochrome o ubiquinol oxidase subunit III [Thiotrichaceae bacterium]